MAFAKKGGKAAASKAAPRSGVTQGKTEAPASETRFGHPGSGKPSNDKNKAR
jgi:hypothetical protein